MGLSYGSSSSNTNQSNSSTANKTFSPAQTAVQDQLGSTLSTDLSAASSGTLTPGVTAEETQAADQINQTSSGLTDRVNKFLAARGFGSSGETGKASLEGELSRESQLGNNAANFAGVQQNVNGSNLLAALNYALTNLGTSSVGTSSGSTSGSNFGANISGAVAF